MHNSTSKYGFKERNIQESNDIIYIYQTRDYADLLWSRYNYWCDPTSDKSCISNNRWIKPLNVRNPENFDKMIRHTNKLIPSLPFLNNSLEAAKTFYKKNIEYLYQNAGEENVRMTDNISFSFILYIFMCN